MVGRRRHGYWLWLSADDGGCCRWMGELLLLLLLTLVVEVMNCRCRWLNEDREITTLVVVGGKITEGLIMFYTGGNIWRRVRALRPEQC